MIVDVDYLVIGSGLAGLTYALHVASYGSVALLTKKTRADANSSWAQGGIAGVIADDDSFDLHVRDTLIAGAGLCNEAAVEVLVREGPERIRELIEMGAQFNMETDQAGQEVLSLGREGGHSRNRIVHTADYTGWECERTLLDAVKRRSEIQVHEHYFVTDLAIETIDNESFETNNVPTGGGKRGFVVDSEGAKASPSRICTGAYALHGETGELTLFRARATLLATGGCGHVYQHTTNPMVATGDGVAMAWRAGAAIGNMEFIQFHPTTLYHPDARAFLITEALRGEGGILQHADGEQFMERYHKLRELAPRDIVARAIVAEMKRRDVPCVYLNVTHIAPDFLRAHFPTVYERCLSVGIDITTQPIPIVPAQHYQCGGVITDLYGATNIARLYAAGEVACTGVHGANRLASNSLLEAMVYGYRAAAHTLHQSDGPAPTPPISLPKDVLPLQRLPEKPDAQRAMLPSQCAAQIAQVRDRIEKTMQQDVGIMRSTAELTLAQHTVNACLSDLSRLSLSSASDWEALNIAQVGAMIIESALCRHESRGLHYTIDYPETLESERHDTVLVADRNIQPGTFTACPS